MFNPVSLCFQNFQFFGKCCPPSCLRACVEVRSVFLGTISYVILNILSCMARFNAEDVLDRIWNDSGDEGEYSDSDDEIDSNVDDDSDYSVGGSDGNTVETDGDSSSDSSEEAVADNNQPQPRQARQPQQPVLVWSLAQGEQPNVFPFTANHGTQVPTAGFEPYDYFSLYINEDFINYLVAETNRFAEQYISSNELGRRSRVHEWYNTNPKEMKQFLGLLFLMGIIRKPALHMYWSRDPLYATSIFGAMMSRNRFQLLLKFLHFNDNSNMPPAGHPAPDKLFKIRPLLDHLLQMFQEVYTPSRNISIDESLLLWKGRLGFRQYIPLKRARFGIKSFMLCEDSGYTYRFKIYTGKEVVPQPQQELSVSERSVTTLMEPLLDKGYHLYIDNWYSSIPLYKYLYQHRTMACGTVRSNRKGLPDQVKQAKLPKGEIIAYRNDELLSLKFKDKKDVFMLTTIHDESMVTRQRRNAVQIKPLCIAEYNKYMGGVDRTDQMLKPYEVARKSLKWYKKVALHFMHLALLNSFIVYNKNAGRKTFLDYQHDVIAVLLFGREDANHVDIPREENIIRLTERHFIAPLPPTENKRKPQKRCRVCYKKGVRKDSCYHCPSCPSKLGLCYFPCFELYHTKFTYWI